MCTLGNPGVTNRSYICANLNDRPDYNEKYEYDDKTISKKNETDGQSEPNKGLDEIRKKKRNRIVIGHLHINSLNLYGKGGLIFS